MAEIKHALVPGTLLSSGEQTYRVVKTLGAGGFGITYLVEAQVVDGDNVHSFFYAMKEHFLNRCCERAPGASKVVYSNPVADEVQNSQRDFVAEAVRLQKLGSRHDNIVKVKEIFEANNTAYYVMEYLQGDSLRDYVSKRGRLTEQETMALTGPILDAIGFLHANRMTHLDIKPDNIMLTPDATGNMRPVLIDFGLSKHYDGQGRPTSTINTLGCSDGYSPIEQYGGITTFSPTADIYSLGATMAYCLTGQNPKKATDMMPGEVEQFANQGSGLGMAIAQMMNMNRSKRPQTAAEVFQIINSAPQQPAYGSQYGPQQQYPQQQYSQQQYPQQPQYPQNNPNATYVAGGNGGGFGGNGGNGSNTMAFNPGANGPLPPFQQPFKPQKQGGSKKGLFIGLGIVGALALIAGVVFAFMGPKEGSVVEYDRNDMIPRYIVSNGHEEESVLHAQNFIEEYASAPMAVSLMWDRSKDIDLVVVDPNDEAISFLQTSLPETGAEFLGDSFGGANSSETITWTDPASGNYDVFVRAGSQISGSLPVYVGVRYGNTAKFYKAVLHAPKQDDVEEPHFYRITSFDFNSADAAPMTEAIAVAEVVEEPVEDAVAEEAVAVVEEPARTNNTTTNNPVTPPTPATDNIPVTYTTGSTESNSFGSTVTNYYDANTTTRSDASAVSRANNVGRSSAPLKITLLWDFSGDCDLIVNQADQTDIYYGNRTDSDTGAQHTGDSMGGNNSYESVSWTNPGNGIYDVYVRVRSVPSNGGVVKVVVKKGSTTTVYTTRVRKSNSDSKDIRICQFNYSGGSTPTPTPDQNIPDTYTTGSTSNCSYSNAVDDFYRANTTTRSDAAAVSRANSVGGSGPLKFTLLWDFSGDCDLIVNQANTTDVWRQNTSTSYNPSFSGDQFGGSGSYESISFRNPGNGSYDAFVQVRSVPSSGGIIKLVVKNGNTTTTYATRVHKSGSDIKTIKMAMISYSGGSDNGGGGSNSNGPASYATSSNSYSSGSTVTSYYTANTSTAYDSNAVSRANSVHRSGTVKVTLLWDASVDLDLICNQANGTDIYFGHTSDSGYGASFSGDKFGGSGSFESVAWSNPRSGLYDVFVRCRGTSIPSGGVPIKVVVKNGSNTTVYSTRLMEGGGKDYRICQFNY